MVKAESYIPLVLAAILFLGCNFRLEVAGNSDLPAGAQQVLEAIQEGKADRVAALMIYPPAYSAEELSQDRQSLTAALSSLLEGLGPVSQIAESSSPVKFHELGVGTGPRPGWWDSSSRDEEPLQFKESSALFNAQLGSNGAGLLRLSIAEVEGQIGVVGLFLGFPTERAGGKELLRAASSKMFDRLGVPPDHPGRQAVLEEKTYSP